MNRNRPLAILFLTMVSVTIIVAGVVSLMLYDAAFEAQRERLVEIVESRARLLESVARFDREHSGADNPEDAFELTLSQIRDAHSKFSGFGETGEFTLGMLQGEQIVFLLSHRHGDHENPPPVSLQSETAEPMRRALLGQSGSMVGLDYRDAQVLAAYEPVRELDLGVVAKIDVVEIRAPFLRAGTMAGVIGLVLILTGSLVYAGTNQRVTRYLKESERKYKTLFELSPDIVFLVDSTLEIVDANPMAGSAYGYSLEELRGQQLRNLIHPDSHHVIQEGLEAIRQGEPLTGQSVEVRKDGSTFPSDIKASPTFQQEGEKIIFTIRDVSKRVRVESELRDSQQKYRGILENLNVGVSLLSPDLKILEMNQKMREWFPDVDPSERPYCYGVYKDPPRDAPCTYCPSIKVVQDCQVHEAVTETPTGKDTRNFRIIASPILDESGALVSVIELIEDVTDKMKMEQNSRQTQKLEALGTLAGGIAHDFNNILAAILGYTELTIADLPEDSSLHPHLEQVVLAGARGKALTGQILAFGRQGSPGKKAVRLNAIIGEILPMMRATTPKNVIIEHTSSVSSDWLLADPGQIQQVLVNLTSNAVHVLQESGGNILVSVSEQMISPVDAAQTPDLRPGAYLQLTVQDTGPGIPPGLVDRIFDPFFTTKAPGEGSGMGLAVVHGIASGHGGTVWVGDVSGRLSSFNVLLPRIETPAKLGTEEHSRYSAPASEARILFVDDEPALVELAIQMLGQNGHDVTATSRPVEALSIFRSNPEGYDLVITDQTMPEKSGTELAKELLEIRADIPIILCSGYGEALSKEEPDLGGIREFLAKPVTRAKLQEAIDRVLRDTTVSSKEVS